MRYRVLGALAAVQVCHCAQCRRAQGSAFATNIPVAKRDLEFLCGEDLLRSFESSPGKERVFCSRCGSPVLSRRTSRPDVVRLRAGLLEEPLELKVDFHFHVDNAASWWPIEDDGLPRYGGSLT
ncbi:GFA family protein [Hydrogenophaga sp. 5NK40-0174]